MVVVVVMVEEVLWVVQEAVVVQVRIRTTQVPMAVLADFLVVVEVEDLTILVLEVQELEVW